MYSNEISLYVVPKHLFGVYVGAAAKLKMNYVSRHIERQIALRKSIFTKMKKKKQKVPQFFSRLLPVGVQCNYSYLKEFKYKPAS